MSYERIGGNFLYAVSDTELVYTADGYASSDTAQLPKFVDYPCSSPALKLKRTSNTDTETSGTDAYNIDVLPYKER